ncbi:hypothetical protein SDC9_196722 [bioreactor metagenome]|uniref:Uncharacterized protein n=1 Tax=bioreactor metagenome TaxID=1076179 RepID=A0A645IF58_9ZZZZ
MIGGGTAGPQAGNKAAVLLQIIGDLHHIEGDGRIKEGEEDDEQRINQLIPEELGVKEISYRHSSGTGRKPAGNLSGEGQDGHSKNDGDNAGLVDPQRDMGVLSPIHFTAHNPLGVLHRYPALAFIQHYHCRYHQDGANQHDQHHKDVGSSAY